MTGSTIASYFSKYLPYTVVICIFGIIYIGAFSFTYMEGDSASSVAFHALGRDTILQPPYSPYHGMMDLFLGVFPADETIVRYAAISSSAVAAVVMVLLIALLIRGWFPNIENWQFALINITILLCSPEIFFLGLVYTPSLFAMSFVLAAHLLVRTAQARSTSPELQNKRFIPIFVLSAALFGIGVSCRWDIGAYMIFICASLILDAGNRESLNQSLKFISIWAGLAFASSILAIMVSGYGINEIYWALTLAKVEIASADSWYATIGAYQTLVTPAFAVFFIAGWICLLFTKRKLAILAFVGILSVAPYIYSREPKMLVPAFPAIWLMVATGINLVWFSDFRRSYLMPARVIMIILLIIPWVVGLQISSPETSWGPGFQATEIAPHSSGGDVPDRITEEVVADRSIPVTKWKLSLKGGFAIPTPEGPRPLGGYGSVLLGGEWRLFAAERAMERRSAIERAMEEQLNILQDEGNSIIVTKLAEMGFATEDARGNYGQNGVNERRFTNAQGRTVKLQVLKVRKSLFDPDQILELTKLNPDRRVILYSGYSSTLRKLFKNYPEAVQSLGPFSAIVDTNEFYKIANTFE